MSTYQAPGSTAQQTLRQLRQAHVTVRRCIQEMEDLTSKGPPDPIELTAARFRISRASLNRRVTSTRACHDLHQRATEAERAALVKIRETDRTVMQKSTDHVTRWTIESILDDWPGYCSASKEIRREMLRELAVEEQLLLPILEQRRFDSARAA